jgi:GAF domain-containing protein
VHDVTESEIFGRGRGLEVLLDSGVRSVQSTPVMGTSGQLLGVLSTHSSFPREPAPKELKIMDYLAASTATLLEWYNAEATSSAIRSE